MGMVAYMSPEQVRGQDLDHRSDIFSFGIILYEMLSGQRAFRDEMMADVMSAITRDDPPELSETNPKISPQLDRLVRRCLEKKAEHRFQTASDLGFALEAMTSIGYARALAGEPRQNDALMPIAAPPSQHTGARACPGWRERLHRWPRYKQSVAGRGTVMA